MTPERAEVWLDQLREAGERPALLKRVAKALKPRPGDFLLEGLRPVAAVYGLEIAHNTRVVAAIAPDGDIALHVDTPTSRAAIVLDAHDFDALMDRLMELHTYLRHMRILEHGR